MLKLISDLSVCDVHYLLVDAIVFNSWCFVYVCRLEFYSISPNPWCNSKMSYNSDIFRDNGLSALTCYGKTCVLWCSICNIKSVLMRGAAPVTNVRASRLLSLRATWTQHRPVAPRANAATDHALSHSPLQTPTPHVSMHCLPLPMVLG